MTPLRIEEKKEKKKKEEKSSKEHNKKVLSIDHFTLTHIFSRIVSLFKP